MQNNDVFGLFVWVWGHHFTTVGVHVLQLSLDTSMHAKSPFRAPPTAKAIMVRGT